MIALTCPRTFDLRERRGVSCVLPDKSSSLSELELPLACKPSGAPGREEDDEPDLFVSRDGGRIYVGGEGALALRGDGDLVVKEFFRLDPRPSLALCENEEAFSFSSSSRPGERPRGFSGLLRRGGFFCASSARCFQKSTSPCLFARSWSAVKRSDLASAASALASCRA